MEKAKHRLDKSLFYDYLERFASEKHIGIVIDMPINKNEIYYRLIFDWTNRKPNGDFQPIMTAQFIDIRKSGCHKYMAKDLNWDCRNEDTTTQYKLWKFLDKWITDILNAE